MTLVLASASTARRDVLRAAGIEFDIQPADIDERAAEAPFLAAGAPPADLAAALAMAKAVIVSQARPGDLVIGADQILELDGERLVKPADMEAARRQLLALSGKTHQLHAAVCGAKDGAILWQATDTAHMTMRQLTPQMIGRYLARVGAAALSSVGAYQIEGRGVGLFAAIEGSHFTILGLPMLPLLAFLRDQGQGDP